MLNLERIEGDFSICKVTDYSQADLAAPFCFLGKTDEECSLVCPTACVPPNTLAREDGWKAFRIQGMLDFSLLGILARIAAVLSAQQIGIFVVSTFNTDYVLTKQEHYENALAALQKAGYTILG